MGRFLSRIQRRHLAHRARTTCAYCDRPIWRFPPPQQRLLRATIDHILPAHRRGGNQPENLKTACLWCNNGRQISGDCIAALRCAEAVVGRDDADIRRISRWWRSIRHQ